jgi:hypothetical protein
MKLSRVVNTLPVGAGGVVVPAGEEGRDRAVPAFITPASLITVSGGTAAVTLLWTVAKALAGDHAKSSWVPFGISLVVGLFIYIASLSDKSVRISSREKAVGVFVAFLNSMVLFCAAMGILGR